MHDNLLSDQLASTPLGQYTNGCNFLNSFFPMPKAAYKKKSRFSYFKPTMTRHDICRQSGGTRNSKPLKGSQLHVSESVDAVLRKMPAHQLSQRVHDGPITGIYGGRPANHEVRKLLRLKWAIRSKMLSKRKPCSSSEHIRVFDRNHTLGLITFWTSAVDCIEWFIDAL